MGLEAGVLVPPTAEVPLIEGEIETAIRDLASRGIGSKTIAREVSVARNTVRRYLRQAVAAGAQTRPRSAPADGCRSCDGSGAVHRRGRRQCGCGSAGACWPSRTR